MMWKQLRDNSIYSIDNSLFLWIIYIAWGELQHELEWVIVGVRTTYTVLFEEEYRSVGRVDSYL